MSNDNAWCPENDLMWIMEQAERRGLFMVEENRKLRARLAEAEAQREWLKDAIENCLEYANGRESEWGNRAIDSFKILKEALAKLEEK